MGQYWDFLNVTLREMGPRNGSAKLGEFFFFKQGFLVRSITIPIASPKLEAYLNTSARIPSGRSRLLSLPDELLLQILYDVAPDIVSLGSFAITCRQIFELAYHDIIKDRRIALSAPWQSCRIVCIGDYARYDDLPKTLLTDTERAEIRKVASKKGCSSDSDNSKDDSNSKDNNNDRDDSALDDSYCDVGDLPGLKSIGGLWLGAFTECTFTREADNAAFRAVLGVTFPNRKDWVLCNSIKRQYVRASAVAELAGHPNDAQPFLPNCRLDLGHALLKRICWSYDSSVSLNDPSGYIHRGAWVGDQFCITTMDRLPGEAPASAWSDVSDEIVKELEELCRANFGEDWIKRSEIFSWYNEAWFSCDS